jgi:hypothetical protein
LGETCQRVWCLALQADKAGLSSLYLLAKIHHCGIIVGCKAEEELRVKRLRQLRLWRVNGKFNIQSRKELISEVWKWFWKGLEERILIRFI